MNVQGPKSVNFELLDKAFKLNRVAYVRISGEKVKDVGTEVEQGESKRDAAQTLRGVR